MTREELLNIIKTDHVQCGEAAALARMALAAMDSEPVAYIPKSQLNLLKNRVMVEADLSKVQRFDEIPLYRHAQQPVVGVIDNNLIEFLRLVDCMLEDYRNRNYGDAERWMRHINDAGNKFEEMHQDSPYSVLANFRASMLATTPQETDHVRK